MQAQQEIVILGGGYAGLLATLRLRGHLKPQEARITLINASDRFVERIRLHQLASDQRLRQWSIPKFLRGKAVDFVQGWITALDPDGQTVTVQTDTGERHLHFDHLLYTLGSSVVKATIPGLADHAYAIGKREQSEALRSQLRQSPAGTRVAIIGGGLTGIESATEIAETYPQFEVSLWTSDVLGAGLSDKGRDYLRQTFTQLDINLHENQRVDAVTETAIQLENNTEVAYDIAIWTGSFAVSPLAREAGLSVNAIGQIRVDAMLRSISHPAIIAAGDAAGFIEDPGAPIRMACATAMPMGAHAADNLAAAVKNQTLSPFNFAYAIQCISLGRHRGLVQRVNSDDTPQENIYSGRAGAIIKELICQYTTWSLRIEALFPGTYAWPGKGQIASQRSQAVQQA